MADDEIGEEIDGEAAPRVDQPVLAARYVWTVHVTRPGEVRPTDAVFRTEEEACTHARAMSTDTGTLAASVVRFTVGEFGTLLDEFAGGPVGLRPLAAMLGMDTGELTRKGVAMFVDGKRQMVSYVSDCRRIHAGGRKQ